MSAGGYESEKETVICHNFRSGFPYKEIVYFLKEFHSINITIRHLNRLLRSYGLFKRGNRSSINDVIDFIYKELEGSISCFGCRSMHGKLRGADFNVSRETVRIVLKNLDPDGVRARNAHRLTRRVYYSPGPNQVWHIDGHDKLKPYGFAIHGAMDGCSRKVLWLRVNKTNNDPKVIAIYYMDFVASSNITARLIRADRGSENVVVCGIQRFFRRGDLDSLAGVKSFRYGASTSNQRIECWWSILRKGRLSWWMDFFKDLIEQNLFDQSLEYQCECLRFCFMGLIQQELDETLRLWNSHYIRKVRNATCPSGRPDVPLSCS